MKWLFQQRGVGQRVKDGLGRVFSQMARVRGLVELASLPLTAFIPVFPIKHFIEGFFGVNRLIQPWQRVKFRKNPDHIANNSLFQLLRGKYDIPPAYRQPPQP